MHDLNEQETSQTYFSECFSFVFSHSELLQNLIEKKNICSYCVSFSWGEREEKEAWKKLQKHCFYLIMELPEKVCKVKRVL